MAQDIATYKIQYKSDFLLTLHSDAGWGIPFCIKFWTGEPARAYYVGWTGSEYKNCKVDAEDATKLLVLFDDHGLSSGELKMQIAYHTTIAEFPNAIVDEVLNQMAVTTVIEGVTNKVVLDFNGESDPEVEYFLPAYANEAQRIANEEQRIANEAQRIENEEARIAAEQTRQQQEQQRIQHEQARVQAEQQRANDYASLKEDYAEVKADAQAATGAANDAATLANQKAQLAADKAALAQAAADLANAKAQLAADNAALAASAAQLANDKAALAQQKAEYAQTQGGYAKDQGDYAKDKGDICAADHLVAVADHGIAVDDHTQAGNDHTRAESDHGIAVDDHTQAGNDHTRAESDHGIAADDHTQAGTDHQTAAADHQTATADHAQAGNDHTRAESDHTRAESDHDAVELYVDSLGVFDLSKHNAVGGVLATYADLSAALTALNALESKYKYGGMSFKFVHSSDNKYVQARCMAQNFTTDVAYWQGVDTRPTERSRNLVESGSVFDSLIQRVGKKPGNNILDNKAQDVTLSSWIIDAAGNTQVSDTLNITGYIAVEEGETYYKATDGGYFRSLIFYDADKNVVAGSYMINKNSFDVPDGASFVRMSMYKTDWEKAQLSTESINYIPYNPIGGYKIGNNNLDTDSVDTSNIKDHAVTEDKLAQDAVKAIAYSKPYFEIGTCGNTGYLNSNDRARCTILCRNKTGLFKLNNVSPSPISVRVAYGYKNGSFSYYGVAGNEFDIPANTQYDYIVVVIEGYSNFTGHLDEIDAICGWNDTLQELSDRKKEVKFAEYDNILLNEEVDDLIDENTALQKDLSLLESVKRNSNGDIVTLSLVNTSAKRLILNLHKSVGSGMAAYNNIYLPNAENDFSDVKVKDNKGNILKYHVVSRESVDFSQPTNLPDTPILANSHGTLFAGDTSIGLVMSEDNGVTWQQIFSSLTNPQAYAVYVDENDALFFSSPSKLYKSEYPYTSASMVLDLTDATEYNAETGQSLTNMTDCYIFTNHFVKYGNAYYCAGYQYENWIRIYKSVDGGDTWTLNFSYIDTETPQAYQHVHNLYLDTYTNTMYAGCDREGHVFKSTDGTTWTDIWQDGWDKSTDYGVIYAASGYRLLGGETSIKGGASIQRTTDDINLTTVLANGHGFYMAEKFNGIIYAVGVSSNSHRSSAIYKSSDGVTWKPAYLLPRISGIGASDGFRYLKKVSINNEEMLFAGCQYYDNNLLIKSGHFSQIIVDVPNGVSSITIESGYLKGNIGGIFNNVTPQNALIDLPLNEHQDYVLERIKKNLFAGVFEWENIGKNIGDIVPTITQEKDKYSLLITDKLEGFQVGSLSLSGGFHIGFWARLTNDTSFELLSINNQKLLIVNYQLRVNDWQKIVSIGAPTTLGTLNRYDINISSNGDISAYTNGEAISTSINASEMLVNGQGTVLVPTSIGTKLPIQHLTITSDLVTQDEALELFYAGLNDNH